MIVTCYFLQFHLLTPTILHCIIYLHHLLSLLFAKAPSLWFLFYNPLPVLIAMDSRNSYSESSSYVGLLNSQNFLYESFPSTINIGASEILRFSSQQTDAPTLREDTLVDCMERRKWTLADDDVLISGWLNTSKDAVVGNEQKPETFWKRVG